MRVISFVTQKGGPGKTTSAIETGHGVFVEDKRVLYVDFDHQADLTEYFGHNSDELDRAKKTVSFAIAGMTPLDQVIIKNDTIPDLLPAGESLYYSEIKTDGLRQLLDQVRDQYDFVFIDSGPGDLRNMMAILAASHGVMIPAELNWHSVKGLRKLLKRVYDLQEEANPNLKVLGIVPTKFSIGHRNDEDYYSDLQSFAKVHGIKLMAPIRRSTKFPRAANQGQSTVAAFPKTPGAIQYRAIAQHLIDYYDRL